MIVKTSCPPDCPRRSGECHADCKTYKAAWDENMKRYAQNAKNRVFDDITTAAVNARMKQMHRKQKQV